jgi:phospholipid transport system substrate-binding protein
MMRFALALSLLFSVVAITPQAYAADDVKAVSSFVDKVASSGFNTIKDKRAGKVTEDQAKTNFRKILNDAFDVSTIAHFTLGRYWRVATPAQQKEFTGLMQTAILDKYADRVLSYSGDGYKVTDAKAATDTDYTVSTLINRADGAPVNLDWRVRKINGTLKVIDISVEGISMSVTHRSDFASVIERNGGQVQALIDALKNQDPLPSEKK